MYTCVNMDISFFFLPEALYLPSIHATLCAHYLASNHCLALPGVHPVHSAQPCTETDTSTRPYTCLLVLPKAGPEVSLSRETMRPREQIS